MHNPSAHNNLKGSALHINKPTEEQINPPKKGKKNFQSSSLLPLQFDCACKLNHDLKARELHNLIEREKEREVGRGDSAKFRESATTCAFLKTRSSEAAAAQGKVPVTHHCSWIWQTVFSEWKKLQFQLQPRASRVQHAQFHVPCIKAGSSHADR